MITKPVKLGSLAGDEFVPHLYSNHWTIQQTTGPARLIIGPRSDHIKLMLALSRVLAEPFGVLYVLLITRRGHTPARYQSPHPLARRDLEQFFQNFSYYFEGDGRHHIWLRSFPDDSTIVYDQHNVIYVYGELRQFEDILGKEGLQRGEVSFPSPHSHYYNDEFDNEEERILKYWDWRQSPLMDNDHL